MIKMLCNKPSASTDTLSFTYNLVSNGVRTTASIVEMPVILTDKATFARARKATTFEAVPPGQQETSTKPTAMSLGSCIM